MTEIILFTLFILTVASMIAISMVAFTVAIKSLIKVNELKEIINNIKNK